MEEPILISYLNDFIFCPASIYFHQLYGSTDTMLFQSSDQINGTHAHEAVDAGKYSTKSNVLQAIPVYCEQYNIIGKIDLFDIGRGLLTERKKKITTIYDGYVFQLYAQYFALLEMGYQVKTLRFYAVDSNKIFPIPLPQEDMAMFTKFKQTVAAINAFKMENFRQTNAEKCRHCIYEPACDRSLL